MRKVTSEDLRKLYLGFWEEKGHSVIESAPVVPKDDPTVLFTSAGMQQLIPYFIGKAHPAGKMLTDIQRCIRTVDIDAVGDESHLTCFEMLGVWSLGAYWKKEIASMTYEFLTSPKYLGLPNEKLFFTVFEGDKDIPKDEESYNAWVSCGAIPSHIYYLSREYNFWGLGTGEGPCGTDSEIFYDTGKKACSEHCNPSCSCGKYMEIGNNVLIQFNLDKNGIYHPLEQKSIDQGMGFERLLMLMNGVNSAYDTDLYDNMKDKISALSGKSYEGNEKSYRIVMDHMKTAVFILGDKSGIKPSNKEQGYVLRRLIRRAIRHLKNIGIQKNVLQDLAKVIIEDYGTYYPELKENASFILNNLEREEITFNRTIDQGVREYKKAIKTLQSSQISGELAFRLFDTYGFPIELTEEMAKEDGLTVDMAEYQTCYKKHQELSRANAEQKFKGGLADSTDKTAKLHTATHILHAILRDMFGTSVAQKGSNITEERLRFDFSFDRKITPEEIDHINKSVNAVIRENIPVVREEMTVDAAKKSGAIGLFESKYGEKVSVYTIGDVSKEICGGPHAKSTGELGHFEIKKEEASSAGVRRIKATLQA